MRRPLILIAVFVLATAAAGCAKAIPFEERPAHDYVHSSGQQLRVTVLDHTATPAWNAAVNEAVAAFANASPMLDTAVPASEAHIVITVRRYTDDHPPHIDGYRFQPGVGGFAAVYDVEGRACNFPPSPLPLNCSGEISHAEIYLNDAIPAGADLEGRRLRLVMHELGHALGLTRHAPDVDAPALAARYGW